MSSRLLFGDINTATQNMSGRAYQRKNLFGYKLFLLGKVIARKDGDLLFSDQKLLFLATELSRRRRLTIQSLGILGKRGPCPVDEFLYDDN